ncbi:hypothetical protein M9458_057952, partial [Cirrhinus mrigala]
SPVKLTGVSLSKSRQGKDKCDVLFNAYSKLSIAKGLPFAFEENLLKTDDHV